MTRPRIGFKPASYDVTRASARLRAFLPCEYLAAADWDVAIVPPDSFDPRRWDCVVFQKSYSEGDLILAERLRSAGTRIVADLCDNHIYNPNNDPKRADRADRLCQLIAMADAVSVSTPTLAEYLALSQYSVVDDALDVPQRRGFASIRRRLRKSGGDRLRLVWFGNSGELSPPFGLIHLQSILPELEAVHRKHQMSLTVITDSRELFDHYLAGTSFPARFVRWHQETFFECIQEHDICILPVKPNPLTVCKSNNRLAVALLLGVPTVAGRIPSYLEFENWILFDDWDRNLSLLAADRSIAQPSVKAANQYVERTYTPQRVVRQWADVLALAIDQK